MEANLCRGYLAKFFQALARKQKVILTAKKTLWRLNLPKVTKNYESNY